MVDARGNTVTQGFILVPATGSYIQQGVRVHCIILHRSAHGRGVQARREREGSSQVSARVIEASDNIMESERVWVSSCVAR